MLDVQAHGEWISNGPNRINHQQRVRVHTDSAPAEWIDVTTEGMGRRGRRGVGIESSNRRWPTKILKISPASNRKCTLVTPVCVCVARTTTIDRINWIRIRMNGSSIEIRAWFNANLWMNFLENFFLYKNQFAIKTSIEKSRRSHTSHLCVHRKMWPAISAATSPCTLAACAVKRSTNTIVCAVWNVEDESKHASLTTR